MKKLPLFLGAFGALNLGIFANAIEGTRIVTFERLSAWGNWGIFSPLNTEENSRLPQYSQDCSMMYQHLQGTQTFLKYHFNESTGQFTATVNYQGTSVELDGGEWERNPAGWLNGQGEYSKNYSLSQFTTTDLPEVFKAMKMEAIKLQYAKPHLSRKPPMIILSFIFPNNQTISVPSKCFLSRQFTFDPNKPNSL